MKDRKTVIRVFTVADWQKEEEFLRRMHRDGWKLVRVSGMMFCSFERCEPQDVIYQLDYNAQIDNREEYLQLFRDCGWEYLQDLCGYSYFRKPVSEMNGKEEEIFCDDESRLEMIGKAFRGKIVPLIPIFCCVIIPQMIGQFLQGGLVPYVLGWIFTVLFALYLGIFIRFGVSYRRLKKKMGK